jgi:hypothetical protein
MTDSQKWRTRAYSVRMYGCRCAAWIQRHSSDGGKSRFIPDVGGGLLFYSNNGGWSPTGSTRHIGHQFAYCTSPGWLWWWWIWWNDDWQGKPKYSKKTCPSVALSTINPTWSVLGANPGHRGGKPETNRLSYVTVPRWRETSLHCAASQNAVLSLHPWLAKISGGFKWWLHIILNIGLKLWLTLMEPRILSITFKDYSCMTYSPVEVVSILFLVLLKNFLVWRYLFKQPTPQFSTRDGDA